jgi:hypothetical protein
LGFKTPKKNMPSLTKLAAEGLSRSIQDAQPFPKDLLDLIVAYCIPFTLFIVNVTYEDDDETRYADEIGREERDELWRLDEFISFLRIKDSVSPFSPEPVKINIVETLCTFLSRPCPNSLEPLSFHLWRVNEEFDITVSVDQIDLLNNRLRRLNAAYTREWSRWSPVRLQWAAPF